MPVNPFFSSRLGMPQPADIMILGYQVNGYPAQYVQNPPSCSVTPRFFTGELGLCLSRPGYIEPGINFARMITNQQFTASLNFTPKLFAFKPVFRFSNAMQVITQIRNFVLQVMNRTVSQLETIPSSIDVSSSGQELIPLNIDFTNYLQSQESVINDSFILRIQGNKTVVPPAQWQNGAAVIVGSVVQVVLQASGLQLNQTYELLTTITTSNNRILTAVLVINVAA